MNRLRRILAFLLIFILVLPNLNGIVLAKEFEGWEFTVFGDNTSDEKNPDFTINTDGSIKLETLGGKISSSVDGLSFYHKEIPADTNFEISTKATVQRFGANNQVSFGLMIRDQIGEHRKSAGHEANYVAVGALDQAIKGFYKQETQQKLDVFDSKIPTENMVYDLKIKKSGNTYVVSSNGVNSEPFTLDGLFTNKMFVGLYVARDAVVTFSHTTIDVDTNKVEKLTVDSKNMKTNYLLGESLQVANLAVTAELSEGSSKKLTIKDFIVTDFNNSKVGKNNITIHYNGATAKVELDIVALTVTDLAINYYPAKTEYYIGDIFDAQGFVVTATYNDGYKIMELTDDQYYFSVEGKKINENGYVFEKSGTIYVTVTSKETPEQSITFPVIIKQTNLVELEMRNAPAQTIYFIGDKINLAGMEIYAKYSDDTEVRLMTDEYEVTGFDTTRAGKNNITIVHKGVKANFPLTIKVKEVEGIEVSSYPKTTYYIGENFDSKGIVVSKVYDNSEREPLTDVAYTIVTDNFNNQKAGTYSIEVVPTDSTLPTINLDVTVKEKTDIVWKEISFGQSSSAKNNYIERLEGGIIKMVALDGGGKVTGDHDGITFYYTEIDAKHDNFTLSADITVNEYAKTPYDGQESFGIMARDAIGVANDSSVFASNIAAIGGFSGGTKEVVGTQLFVRTGVIAADGEGSQGIQKVMIDPVRPKKENTADNYRLTLAKTNSGILGQLNNGTKHIIFEPSILNVQDEKIYVGFYAGRLATIEVRNIDFSVTASGTDSPKVLPPAEAISPILEVLSLDKTSNIDYTLKVKSNVNGIVTIKQDKAVLSENKTVEAGKVLDLSTIIADNADTNFSIVFLPDDTQYVTDYNKTVQNFTVKMKTYTKNEDIYVSPAGTTNGDGTKNNPLDLDTAIEFVTEGQKIIVLDGHYLRNSKLEIKKSNDGTAEALKYLIADPDTKGRPVIDFDKKSVGVVHSGNYWHVEGIDFTRSAGNEKGYTLGGSYNTIENIRTFENGDTGLQISRTDASEKDKSKWPSHNLILNSVSFDNRDPSENNADGFAAKLTSGEGNIFRGTVAYNNIDDGWDLYTKVGTGAIGAVLIEDSIAFNNGRLSNGYEGNGDGNGFKLGGEGIHVPHMIKNSIAFGNSTYGFTSNSNPGVVSENNISVNNGTNLGFTTYTDIKTDFTINHFLSIRNKGTEKDQYPSELKSNQNYMFDGKKSTNKSGKGPSAELSDAILKGLEEFFNYDSKGNILSVKGDKWTTIWTVFDEIITLD